MFCGYCVLSMLKYHHSKGERWLPSSCGSFTWPSCTGAAWVAVVVDANVALGDS